MTPSILREVCRFPFCCSRYFERMQTCDVRTVVVRLLLETRVHRSTANPMDQWVRHVSFCFSLYLSLREVLVFLLKNCYMREQQRLVSQGRILKHKKTLESYNIKDGETIVMTLQLVGGTKRGELMPAAIKEEREAKRRTSESQSDTSGFDEARLSDVKFEDQSSSSKYEEKMEEMMQKIESNLMGK